MGRLTGRQGTLQRDSNVGCCITDGNNLNCSEWFWISRNGHETSMLGQDGKTRRERLPLESFTQRLIPGATYSRHYDFRTTVVSNGGRTSLPPRCTQIRSAAAGIVRISPLKGLDLYADDTLAALRAATSLGTSNIQHANMLDQNHLDFILSMIQNVTHRHGVR